MECESWPAIEMGVCDVYMTDDDKITWPISVWFNPTRMFISSILKDKDKIKIHPSQGLEQALVNELQ